MQEENGHFDDARKDYEQALAAEPKYIQPLERLSWLALRESKWQELVDRTDQWLRLDPLNSADVYYLSSLGNLQTQHYRHRRKERTRIDPPRSRQEKHADALHPRLGPGADGARFVQQDYLRLDGHGAGNAQSLLLTAREAESAGIELVLDLVPQRGALQASCTRPSSSALES